MGTARHQACVAALGALCVIAGTATEACATDRPPVGASERLRIEVAGVISPRCTVSQSEGDASFGQLLDMTNGGTVARTLKLDFTFRCNSPFRAVMTSQNGGLMNDAAPVPGFRNRITYDAALTLPNGRAAPSCDSERIQHDARSRTGCILRFNGRDGASGAGSVKLSMASDPSPILAGRYRDRLVLRLSPILGGEED